MKENHYLKIAVNEVADIEDLKDYRKDKFNTVSSPLKWGLSFLGTLMVGLLYALLKAIEAQNTYMQLIFFEL